MLNSALIDYTYPYSLYGIHMYPRYYAITNWTLTIHSRLPFPSPRHSIIQLIIDFVKLCWQHENYMYSYRLYCICSKRIICWMLSCYRWEDDEMRRCWWWTEHYTIRMGLPPLPQYLYHFISIILRPGIHDGGVVRGSNTQKKT